MEVKRYPMYKGLQKPLSFKGFKGRYIFWGIGVIISALIIGCVLCITINKVIGLGLMATYLGVGLFLIQRKQKEGLYPQKVRNNTLLIVANRIKLVPKRKEHE